MKLVQVESVPGRNENHKLKAVWEEFMGMGVKTAKAELDVGEYKTPTVARGVWAVSIKKFGYPIDLKLRKNEIYLVRRDM